MTLRLVWNACSTTTKTLTSVHRWHPLTGMRWTLTCWVRITLSFFFMDRLHYQNLWMPLPDRYWHFSVKNKLNNWVLSKYELLTPLHIQETIAYTISSPGVIVIQPWLVSFFFKNVTLYRAFIMSTLALHRRFTLHFLSKVILHERWHKRYKRVMLPNAA